uniref:Uncharacterized protein n=1 Tax=Gossypium raimondii TaxID=29730 RepID=A0A0D2UKC4_GOSRA|nr:hypothetical protein B456_011G006800 [Gossypium raimondii]
MLFCLKYIFKHCFFLLDLARSLLRVPSISYVCILTWRVGARHKRSNFEADWRKLNFFVAVEKFIFTIKQLCLANFLELLPSKGKEVCYGLQTVYYHNEIDSSTLSLWIYNCLKREMA